MSNRVSIQPTIFEDHADGNKTYGVRIYDDYDTVYTNLWNPEDLDALPLDILAKVVEGACQKTAEMLDFVREGQHGIYIGGDWLTWEFIREVLMEEMEEY